MLKKFEAHKAIKAKCQEAKANAKDRANCDATFKTATIDLLSVLQLLSSDISIMYYKRQLCILILQFPIMLIAIIKMRQGPIKLGPFF